MRYFAKTAFPLLALAIFCVISPALAQSFPMGADDLSFDVGGVRFSMVWVEGGTYADADGTDRAVSSFCIGECEVTQGLYMAVMGTNPSSYKGRNLPQEWIRYSDCKRFIGILRARTGMDFRLPTEAEWEWAARGGKISKGFVYSGSDDSREVAWTRSCSGGQIHSVRLKKPNELGLYDMSGGVAEWVDDVSKNSAGSGRDALHVIKGGSWYSDEKEASWKSETAQDGKYRSHWVGFRLAL